MKRRERKYTGLNDQMIVTNTAVWLSTGYEIEKNGEWLAEYEDAEGNTYYKKIGEPNNEDKRN